jgi:hypothetical protein
MAEINKIAVYFKRPGADNWKLYGELWTLNPADVLESVTSRGFDCVINDESGRQIAEGRANG